MSNHNKQYAKTTKNTKPTNPFSEAEQHIETQHLPPPNIQIGLDPNNQMQQA